MCEGFPPGDIVYQQCSDGTSVVWPGDWSEIFLPRRVPDLQLDALVPDGYRFGSELHPDGDVMGGTGLVFDELQDHTWFADTGVPDYDELEQIIVIVHTIIL